MFGIYTDMLIFSILALNVLQNAWIHCVTFVEPKRQIVFLAYYKLNLYFTELLNTSNIWRECNQIFIINLISAVRPHLLN